MSLWLARCDKRRSRGTSFGQDIKFQRAGFQPQMVHVSDDQSQTEQDKQTQQKALNRTQHEANVNPHETFPAQQKHLEPIRRLRSQGRFSSDATLNVFSFPVSI